jgi:hypothetical protein
MREAATRFHDAPDAASRRAFGNLRQQTIKESSHGILPLFALNRF